MVRARPSVLGGELVNTNCKKEPVCLKCSGGLVNKNCGEEPVCLKCSKGSLIRIVRRSPSV